MLIKTADADWKSTNRTTTSVWHRIRREQCRRWVPQALHVVSQPNVCGARLARRNYVARYKLWVCTVEHVAHTDVEYGCRGEPRAGTDVHQAIGAEYDAGFVKGRVRTNPVPAQTYHPARGWDYCGWRDVKRRRAHVACGVVHAKTAQVDRSVRRILRSDDLMRVPGVIESPVGRQGGMRYRRRVNSELDSLAPARSS